MQGQVSERGQTQRGPETLQGGQITPRGSLQSHPRGFCEVTSWGGGVPAPRAPHCPGQRLLPPALACDPPPQGLEPRDVPAPPDADTGQADAQPALSAGPQAEKRPQVQRHGQGYLRAENGGSAGPDSPYRAGHPLLCRRALTLPSTTACSPCRITFPGADTAMSRAHIAAASRPAPTDSPTHQSGPRPAPPPPLPANSRAPCEGGTCGRPMGRGLCGVARRWGDSVG